MRKDNRKRNFPIYFLKVLKASNSKFVESADAIIRRNKTARKSKLHTIRKARGFTQQQLADASGVALRMVLLYEQKRNDLSKAQVGAVISLAKALGCEVEDLMEYTTYDCLYISHSPKTQKSHRLHPMTG